MNLIPEKAIITDGPIYDTGIRMRGYEIHATPPNRYRLGTELILVHPNIFTTEVYRVNDFCGLQCWDIGFKRPDGILKGLYSLRSEEDAKTSRIEFRVETARLMYSLRVYLKNGIPTGITWVNEDDYAPMRIVFTQEEAKLLINYCETVDEEWRKQNSAWIKMENDRTEAIASAAALDSLPPGILNKIIGPIECLECGAIFSESGHVYDNGMSCDQCG